MSSRFRKPIIICYEKKIYFNKNCRLITQFWFDVPFQEVLNGEEIRTENKHADILMNECLMELQPMT